MENSKILNPEAGWGAFCLQMLILVATLLALWAALYGVPDDLVYAAKAVLAAVLGLVLVFGIIGVCLPGDAEKERAACIEAGLPPPIESSNEYVSRIFFSSIRWLWNKLMTVYCIFMLIVFAAMIIGPLFG